MGPWLSQEGQSGISWEPLEMQNPSLLLPGSFFSLRLAGPCRRLSPAPTAVPVCCESPGGKMRGCSPAASPGADGPSWWDQGGDRAVRCNPVLGGGGVNHSWCPPHHLGDTGRTELALGSPRHAGEGASTETAREHGKAEERAQAIHLLCASIPNAPGSLPGSSGKH